MRLVFLFLLTILASPAFAQPSPGGGNGNFTGSIINFDVKHTPNDNRVVTVGRANCHTIAGPTVKYKLKLAITRIFPANPKNENSQDEFTTLAAPNTGSIPENTPATTSSATSVPALPGVYGGLGILGGGPVNPWTGVVAVYTSLDYKTGACGVN